MTTYITENLPGIGGVMRTYPEDFVVEEIPAYDLSHQGEHIFIEIVKRQITTQAAVSELAASLNIKSSDIGYAGMKDRQAVTSQRFSVPTALWPLKSGVSSLSTNQLTMPEKLEKSLIIPENLTFKLKILGLHNNKLRTGHLKGNRFTIRLRHCLPNWQESAELIRQALIKNGFANFYGPQRFGREGNNAEVGLKGLKSGRIFGPKWRKWLLISALQSEMFNEWLNERIKDGLFDRAICGDVFGKLPQGGIFYSNEPEKEQPRLDNFEISPLGPIFGYKMFKSQREALAREQKILDKYDLKLEEFRPLKAEGSRRRTRLKIEDLEISSLDGDPVFRFTLPSGSYASVLIGEFTKTADQSAIEEEDNSIE
ncbi:MAG: tRNA pseudouridine(13) synthase TruD [Candidatus Bruticola sp.]